MARMRFSHNTFHTGIISKKVQGNTSFDGYNNALDECVNFQVQHTGGLFKRGGSYFIAETRNSHAARLISFVYSSEQSYICEFGELPSSEQTATTKGYIRFYTKRGSIKKYNSNDILELYTPFTMQSIEIMKYYQEGNLMFFVADTGIYALTRNSNAGEENVEVFSFDNTPVEYTVPPITFMNNKDIALKPDIVGDDGATITIVAVDPKDESKKPNTKYAPVFFDSDASGEKVVNYLVLTYSVIYGPQQEYETDTIHYYLKINNVKPDAGGFNKLTCVVDTYLSPKDQSGKTKLPNTGLVTQWRVSAFTKDRGYPVAAAIYEGRQFLANNKISYPLGIWGSSNLYNDWFNFIVGPNPGDAVQVKTSMELADEILWLVGQSKLFVGTRGGIYLAGSATYNDEAITPSNFRVRMFEATGASPLQPITAMDTVFFVDTSGRNVHEIVLSGAGAYQANDLSLLANDLTQSGIIAHTWQQAPTKTYWCATTDGHLCALTYLKNNNILAWTKHVISGKSVRVLSLSSIHEERNDIVWMVVQREINGIAKKFIEYIYPPYDPLGQEEFKQFYVDSGIIKEQKYTINNITKSKTSHANCDMRAIRTIAGYENEYRVCFKVYEGADALLGKKNIFLARNMTDTGFDFYLDTKSINANIYHKKIDPLDYPDDYAFTSPNTQMFQKIADITGIVSNAVSTFIKCDVTKLSDGNEVLIQNSGIKKTDGTHIDFSNSGETFKLTKTAGGFFLKTLDNLNVVTNAGALSTNAEAYKKINRVTDCDIGSNTVIELKNPILGREQIDDVYINKVVGMSEINKFKYRIRWISNDKKQLVLYDYRKSPSIPTNNLAVIDSSEYSEYDPLIQNNGNCYVYFDTLEGLDHLKGMKVSVCADGNNSQSKIVNNEGKITLNQKYMYVAAGLEMKSWFKTVPFSGGSALGCSDGTVGSQKDISVYLYHSLGGRYGAESRETYSVPYKQKLQTQFDGTQNLFTGLVKLPMPNALNIYGRTIYIEHSEPLAFNILSIANDIQVSDA